MAARTTYAASPRHPMQSASPLPQQGHSQNQNHSQAQAQGACHILTDLLRERAAIEPIRQAVPHLWALLDAEIARLGAATADLSIPSSLTQLRPPFISSSPPPRSPPPPSPAPVAPRKRVKLPVPADRYPEYNFVGRLLGPRGTTLKTLERDTGCKIMIRGKGSIRKDKEPDVRGKPGWEHVFNEALHVVIEVGDALDEASATLALSRAKEAVEVLLVPVPEERDSLKRQQLRALAIMNGTYRGATNPARSHDGQLCSLSNFSAASPPPAHSHPAYSLDAANPAVSSTASVFLGESVPVAVSPHILHPYEHAHASSHSQNDEQSPLFRHMSYPRFEPASNHAYERRAAPRHSGRRTPSSGATSPKTAAAVYGENGQTVAQEEISSLTSKMQHCAVDEFASSSVGDDSPESSHSSEDGEPSTHIIGTGYSGANVKVSNMAMSPGSRAETAVGVGGFLGQEFYNGAFSNGPSPSPWDQTASSSGLYGFSPIPSPQVLTTSSTTVTPIDRRNGY